MGDHFLLGALITITFFKIPVTLWVYGKKVQTEALVDLGATTNFVDRVVVEIITW